MTGPVYLDYAATSPLDPRVAEAMQVWLAEGAVPGNASADHVYGRQAATAIDAAAAATARLVNGRPEEVVWTSGATEADNLAIIGAARFRKMRGQHVVTAATEHKAVLESCAALEREGFSVTYLQPDEHGVVEPGLVDAALRPDTVLVSVMHANNETGVTQDISAIGALCRNRDILFHTDAVQSAGKLPVDMRADCIDLLSLNAHKACGPQGVGALLLNGDTLRRVEPLTFGGGQQRGLRAGTLPVHQIVGMGRTMELLAAEFSAEPNRQRALLERLEKAVCALPGVRLNGHPRNRLPSILNVSVAHIEGESLRYALDELAVSSGSACNSATDEPSYVLRSLGLADRLAEASIRFSIGRFSTAADIDQAILSFTAAVGFLRELAPKQAPG